MSTIGDLCVTSSISSSDKLPVWKNADGVTRALPISVFDSRYLSQDDIALFAASAAVETFVSGIGFTPGVTLAITLANQYLSAANIEVFFDAAFQGPDQYTLVGTTLAFISPIPVGVQNVYVRGGATRLIGSPSDGTVTDPKLANGSKVYNRVFNHLEIADFGPLSSGNAAAAVAAVQSAGGGTLNIASGDNVGYSLPAGYAGVVLDYDGPNTPVNVYDIGDLSGIAGKTFRTAPNGGQTKEQYALFVEARPLGDGSANVPPYANVPLTDYALGVSAVKRNWTTSTVKGEVCGMNVIVRGGYQGSFANGNGDITAFISNVATSSGDYAAQWESTVNHQTGSGPLDQTIRTQIGVINTGNSSSFGFYAAAQLGTSGDGILLANTPGAGAWANYLRCVRDGANNFIIDVTGSITQFPVGSSSNFTTIANASGNFQVRNASSSQILGISQAGVLTTGQVQVTGGYFENGLQVVGPRITGYGTPTGNAQLANFPGASATLAQTSAQLAQLIVDLKTHGLLGA